MPPLRKVLIANRGEIACRVIRSAREHGLRSVAVYSTADAGARHVLMADEAIEIGPALASESYLNIGRIIEAARESGADAVHPGYGFLSENAAFARACAEAGLTFIGPSPEAIDLMGNKAEAKRRMREAGVPCVPGYDGEDQSDAALIAEADKIGFPVMIKAAAGGGGRGMRLVRQTSDMAAALSSARSEARNAFGSGELILEKALERPRHIEIQVMGDTHGNVLHLFERDCSVQRRHQKVLEEAPSPAVTPHLRESMGAAAVKAAHAIGYVGAGTLEFLLDETGAFYFLEMNTRLQVEHPVTEMVTGLDLVSLQFRAAAGLPLGLAQADVRLSGHAIEARLYAEDPARNFMPQSGPVLEWEPADGAGVRIDHGLNSRDRISPHYDPMVAKVVAHGSTREEARARLLSALERTHLLGLITNKAFLRRLLQSDDFAAGRATTALVEELTAADAEPLASDTELPAVAAVILVEFASQHFSPLVRGWRSTGRSETAIHLLQDDRLYPVAVIQRGSNFVVHIDEVEHRFHVEAFTPGRMRLRSGHHTETARFAIDGPRLHVELDGRTGIFHDVTYEPARAAAAAGDGLVRAPMNGRIIAVKVAAGDRVTKGQVLLVHEAMKMENQILAPFDGLVEAVSVAQGDQVQTRQILATLKADGAAA
jgi:geranyl-CoA carboxylase alpha subunit